MTNKSQRRGKMRGFGRRRIVVPLAILVLLNLIVALGYWFWIQQLSLAAESATKKLGNQIGSSLVTGQSIDTGIFRNFIAQEPRAAYLVVANFESGYRHGIINKSQLSYGGQDVEAYLVENGNAATLAKLIEPQSGFANEYMDVISLSFLTSPSGPSKSPVGVLKVGYIVPGFIPEIMAFGRGFGFLFQTFWIFSAIVGLGIVVQGALGGPKSGRSLDELSDSRAVSKSQKSKKDALGDLDSLEIELSKSVPVRIDETGMEWQVLFNEEGLSDWSREPEPNWYLSDGDLVGMPWASSIVRTDIATDGQYIFRVSAKKVTGADGFVILFPCGNEFLYWVVGGWKNKRSEVAGYPETRFEGGIEANKWYDLEVRVGEQVVGGYIGGRQIWEMSRSAIAKSSPDVNFQKGLGVGVWNTVAKFKEILFHAG